MKISILAVTSLHKQSPSKTLLSLSLLFSVAWGTAAAAQEKAAEPQHPAGWVVIPVDEYRVLRAKAYPVEREPEPPPIDATLTRVDYELHVSGELAAGHANLTVDVLKDGWV